MEVADGTNAVVGGEWCFGVIEDASRAERLPGNEINVVSLLSNVACRAVLEKESDKVVEQKRICASYRCVI